MEKNILDNFDWSESVQTNWQNLQKRSDAVNSLNDSDASNKLLCAVILVLLDEINTLRTAVGLSTRTVNQVKTAVINKLNAGDAD